MDLQVAFEDSIRPKAPLPLSLPVVLALPVHPLHLLPRKRSEWNRCLLLLTRGLSCYRNTTLIQHWTNTARHYGSQNIRTLRGVGVLVKRIFRASLSGVKFKDGTKNSPGIPESSAVCSVLVWCYVAVTLNQRDSTIDTRELVTGWNVALVLLLSTKLSSVMVTVVSGFLSTKTQKLSVLPKVWSLSIMASGQLQTK